MAYGLLSQCRKLLISGIGEEGGEGGEIFSKKEATREQYLILTNVFAQMF